MSKHQVVSDITFKTTEYCYSLKEDGTRNIDRTSPRTKDITFSFDKDALAYIIFRDGPSILNIGQYRLYFTYKDNNLTGICLERNIDGENYIYIVSNYKEVLELCKNLYVGHWTAYKMLDNITAYPGITTMADDEYLDEFDIEEE